MSTNWQRLRDPFLPEDIEWKPGAVTRDGEERGERPGGAEPLGCISGAPGFGRALSAGPAVGNAADDLAVASLAMKAA